MSRIGTIDWKRFEFLIFEIGCKFIKQEGDHRKYYKEGILRPVIIPRIKDIPVFIILNNLRILGVSRDQYLKKINNSKKIKT